MINLRLKKGKIPPRPPGLIKTDTDIVELFRAGKTVAYGGLSLLGEAGYVVPVFGIMRIEDKVLTGWCLSIGDRELPSEFRYIDSSTKPAGSTEMPNAIMYFYCEADRVLALPTTPQKKLVEIARFIAPFISDEGPPKGIDW